MKELLKRAGLTYRRFASEVGVTHQCVWLWVSGRTVPNIETMLKICTVLNCSESELLHALADARENKCHKTT